jgi:hypothetical protein
MTFGGRAGKGFLSAFQIAALIVSAFAMGAMANTPVGEAGTQAKAPEATTKVVKKSTHKKMKVSHHAKKHAKLAPSPT